MSRRRRGQAHQNTVAFKNRNPKKREIELSTKIQGCCRRCTQQLEWRLKYGKYKPRKKRGQCVMCKNYSISTAYYSICVPCSESSGKCPKCLKLLSDIVDPPSKEAIPCQTSQTSSNSPTVRVSSPKS